MRGEGPAGAKAKTTTITIGLCVEGADTDGNHGIDTAAGGRVNGTE